jgi:hypothetical protein
METQLLPSPGQSPWQEDETVYGHDRRAMRSPETAFWMTELALGMCFRTDIPTLRHIPLRGCLQNAVEALNTAFH